MDAEDDDDDDDEVQYIVETNVTDVKKFTHNSWNSEETQTLHAGVFEMTYTVSSGTLNPSIPYPPQTPFPGVRTVKIYISWRWSLPLPTNKIW